MVKVVAATSPILCGGRAMTTNLADVFSFRRNYGSLLTGEFATVTKQGAVPRQTSPS